MSKWKRKYFRQKIEESHCQLLSMLSCIVGKHEYNKGKVSKLHIKTAKEIIKIAEEIERNN